MPVPEVALEWCARGCRSNVELAILSNVCIAWRSVVKRVVLEQASESNPRLLLASMVRCYNETRDIDDVMEALRQYRYDNDSFCACWFSPDGIQEQWVFDEELQQEQSPEPFAPSGEEYIGEGDNRRTRAPSRKSILTAREWRGYKNPMQVLESMGYSPHFVSQLLTEGESRSPPECPTYAVRGAVLARPESYCLCTDSLSEDRKQELQLSVLPRIVFTSVAQQKCIQWVNASASHAVCMMTPAFACGPLREAVTIFCVAIATEDGCFFSALHHKFELGHLYPPDKVHEETEMSPICVSTECMERAEEVANPVYCADSEDDDSLTTCHCIFRGVLDKLEAMDDDDSGDEHQQSGTPRNLYRGHMGPGAWHCYTAVVDGADTFIRIDGVPEPMERTHKCDNVMLDGLTIGSDHCFGMSLCCGHGESGWEGEGAIAELAVFHGKLDETDLNCIELYLMQKHGIAAPLTATVHQENVWERQAHALIEHPAFTDIMSKSRTPLRFLARHPSVAWKQSNPVTGQPIRIKKIGCKPGASSSDW